MVIYIRTVIIPYVHLRYLPLNQKRTFLSLSVHVVSFPFEDQGFSSVPDRRQVLCPWSPRLPHLPSITPLRPQDSAPKTTVLEVLIWQKTEKASCTMDIGVRNLIVLNLNCYEVNRIKILREVFLVVFVMENQRIDSSKSSHNKNHRFPETVKNS